MVKMYCRSSVNQPAKFWLFLTFAILLLASVIAIRPLERGSPRNSMVASSESFTKEVLPIREVVLDVGNSKEEEQLIDGEEECEKNEDEAECLNRRSLAAHTDYIYTQSHNGP